MASAIRSKQEELLNLLLSHHKPSSVVQHKISDKGLELNLMVPKDKVRQLAPELLALLMSDAM